MFCSRRGYGSSKLNTDDFVLNASVCQPFFKGMLINGTYVNDKAHVYQPLECK